MARLQDTVVAPAPPEDPMTQMRLEESVPRSRRSRMLSRAWVRSFMSTGQATNWLQPARMAWMMLAGSLFRLKPTVVHIGAAWVMRRTASRPSPLASSRLTPTTSMAA